MPAAPMGRLFGSPGSCGGRWKLTNSGPTAFPGAVKAHNGISPTVLVAYRLIAPGSEWKLHRDWFGKSAMADLLGADLEWQRPTSSTPAMIFCCHKAALFSHLMARWRDLFNANFDVLLYDLTSTYFEINASAKAEGDKRRPGYSRDKRQTAADGNCAGGHPGRPALGLRSAARQHERIALRCGCSSTRGSSSNTAARGVSG